MNPDPPFAGADDRTGAGWVLGGRYRLISQVGAGGMAVVWQAYDEVLARTVAVKVLAAHSTGDPLSRDRIRREARAAAALSHPNIAQVHDYGETSAGGELIPYVVMELVRGGTLHQRLRDGAVLPRYAMRVCAEIAAALAAAHAEGLVHRDIKPANVMLAPTGAKVVDFGIAAAIRPPSGGGADDFEVLGTPAYLAPERLLHDAVEPASDVYALGVLLYRLIAGHSPWTTESTTQMLKAHIYLEPAPLLPMFQVPGPVTDLCNRCLAKDPAQRPSAREAATLLAHAAGLQVITDEAPAPGPEQPAAEPEPSVLIRASAAAVPPPAPDRDDEMSENIAVHIGNHGPPPVDAVTGPPGADSPATTGTGGRKAKRAVFALSAVVLLVALAATLWFLRPDRREAAVSAAPPSAPGLAPGPSRAPAKPLVSVLPSAGGTVPGATAPAGTEPVRPATSPADGAGTTVTVPPPGATAPGAPPAAAPAATTPAVTPATSAAEPAVTTTPPAAEPVERTLSSAAGSVRATCPAAGTAQILSWTATKPYKVARGDGDAGPAPSVSFSRGNAQVTMTVTCDDGVPSATTT